MSKKGVTQHREYQNARRRIRQKDFRDRRRHRLGKDEEEELYYLARKPLPAAVREYFEKEEKFREARDTFYRTAEGKRQHERLRILEMQYQFINGVYSKYDEQIKFGY